MDLSMEQLDKSEMREHFWQWILQKNYRHMHLCYKCHMSWWQWNCGKSKKEFYY